MEIPKILHLCWFGDGEMTPLIKESVESWHRVMPDYEIMEWRDTEVPNFRYPQTALKHGKFANVSNYMRFYALYHYGGIYLDVDVEVVRPFDHLLKDKLFLGWQRNGEINNAVFGSVPKHPLVAAALRILPKVFDGLEEAHVSSPVFTTKIMFEYCGVDKSLVNKLIRRKDVVIYPERYFYPYTWTEEFSPDCVTEDTVCIHHWVGSWT